MATMTPNAVARVLSTSSRKVTPKAVRTMARTVLARFDKGTHPAYQSHEYTAAEVATLRKAFAGRGERAKSQPKRATKTTVRKTVAKVAKAPKVATPDA